MQIIVPNTQVVLDTRRKKKGGKYPVKIRVTYMRQQQYYPTGIDLTLDEFNAVMATKVKQAFRERRVILDAKQQKIREAISGIPHFTFSLLEAELKHSVKDVNNIYPLFEAMFKEKQKQGKIKTASTYRTSIRSFQKFRAKIGFYDITPSFLMSYEQYMLDQNYSPTTVGIHLRNLRTLYNRAINERIILDPAGYPFKKGKYSIPKGRNIKKALDQDEVRKIYELSIFESEREYWARDMWMLLFFFNGVNPTDLFRLKKSDRDGEYITLVRKKTADTSSTVLPVVIYLREEAKEIIDRWAINQDPYLIPGLKYDSTEEKKVKDIDQLVKLINKYMKRIAERLGIEKKCTCYTARHSFAQALKNAGIPIEVISESLGHGSTMTTRAYLNSFRRETIKNAASKLL